MSDHERHSEADPLDLITDPDAKARREAENGVRQYLSAVSTIRDFVHNSPAKFKLNQRLILALHRDALEGIHPLAGTYRNSHVWIRKSKHVPPPHDEVADYVVEMCSYVNDNWDLNAVHLAAYVLWRMNWIHPFADGNGRTARVLSYIVLSIKLNSILPGTPTIPDQIAADKTPYYKALEDSDDSWKREFLALGTMEQMLEAMLARQLLSATEEASI